jgi:hypothetical protein
MLEQLPGEVAAAHRKHDLSRPALGQGVEAAEKHCFFVDDHNLLMHDVDLDDRLCHLPQSGHVVLMFGPTLQPVARVADKENDSDAAGPGRRQQGQN